MPPQIGDFISEHVYDGLLKSNPKHVVPSSVVACRFVDVEGMEQLDADGKSSFVSCDARFGVDRYKHTKNVP
jgi:hypothetical protein